MTTSGQRCPPAPASGFIAPTPLTTVRVHANPEPWVRIFRNSDGPLRFAKSTRPGGNRFDPLPAPWERTNVLYAGSSLETAISEALLRWHGDVLPGEVVTRSESKFRDRGVARFVAKRELTLIDGTALGRAPIEAAISAVLSRPEHAARKNGPKPLADDIFLCSPNEYDETHRWATWFRSQVPHADGLKWVSRQHNTGMCMVLFDDRCGSDLELTGPPVPLYEKIGSAERQVLLNMLGALGWGLD